MGNAQLTCGAAARQGPLDAIGEAASCARLCPPPRCGQCEAVNLTTLDAALGPALAKLRQRRTAGASLPVVAAKLDAEGHECNILAAGTSLLSVHRPMLVQVEVSTHGAAAGKRLRCVEDLASKYGYRVKYERGKDNAYMVRRDAA